MFKPMIEWVKSACINAKINEIMIVNKENDVSNILNKYTENITDMIVMYANQPLVSAEIINKSYEYHLSHGNSRTLIGDKDDNCYWISINEGGMGRYGIDIEKLFVKGDCNMNLYLLNKIANDMIIQTHIDNGVQFMNTDGILIGLDVEIGKDTLILPSTIIKGQSKIGENCTIGHNSIIDNSTIGSKVILNNSQCYNSAVENNVTIGPFSHIRPNSVIKNGVHIGDFVEIKNSTIGEDTSISHLTYVGDSDVGKRVNFGCGVVTVNYNGKDKNRCTIKDDVFIGCNTNLIAPVTLEEKSYTGAGSTITQDVPKSSLAIARARQINKEGYNIVT